MRSEGLVQALFLLTEGATFGDPIACCTYAQLLAYQSQWEGVLDNCSELLLMPKMARSYDNYLNMWRLLALASEQTGEWSQAKEVCQKVATNYQRENYSADFPLVAMLQSFTQYIDVCGVGPRPYLTFPDLSTHSTDCARYFDMLKSFHEYAAEFYRAWSDPSLSDLDVIEDLYSAAMDYSLSKETVDSYEKCKRVPRGFNQRLFLARALALAGRRSQAALIFEQAIAAYVIDGTGDILPVAALWDETCLRLLSAIRIDQVLRNLSTRPPGDFRLPTALSKQEQNELLAGQATFVDLKRWEDQLKGDPKNVELRRQLMCAYKGRLNRYRDCANWHAEHVLWLLLNDHGSDLLRDSICLLEACDAELHARISTLVFDLRRRQVISSLEHQLVLGC